MELARIAHLADRVEVQILNDELLFVGVTDVADELTPRGAEVALSASVVVPEVVLNPHPVDGPHEAAIGDRMAGLFDAPQVLGQAPRGRLGDENDLGSMEAQQSRTLWEKAVIADAHAHPADRRIEDRVAQLSRAKVEVLPGTTQMRDMGLAILAEMGPVGLDDSRGVVVDAHTLLSVRWHDETILLSAAGFCMRFTAGSLETGSARTRYLTFFS